MQSNYYFNAIVLKGLILRASLIHSKFRVGEDGFPSMKARQFKRSNTSNAKHGLSMDVGNERPMVKLYRDCIPDN